MTLSVFMDGKAFGMQRYGGVSRMHYELLRHLAGSIPMQVFRGFAVDGYDWEEIHVDRNINRSRMGSFRGAGRLAFWLERPWLEKSWLDAERSGASIYHASYYRVPFRKGKGRLLVSDFDCIHERFPGFSENAEQMMAMKMHAFQQADLIVSISESSKRDLMEFYGSSEEKIRVCHLGVDSFFELPPSGMPRFTERPYLLYVGSRVPYKNFRIVERIFVEGRLPEYDLVVVGGESRVPERQLPNGGSMRWLRADDVKLRELYWHASALIYPSMHEGFGLPPLEALASGCPVVASDIPVLHEVLGKHAEYFVADDPEELVDAVHHVRLWNPHRRQAAYRHARSYTWKRTAESMLTYYRELL